MARNYSIKFNKKGFAEVRNSERMRSELNKRIDKIHDYAASVDGGFAKVAAYSDWKGRRPRARARVYTYSASAIRAQRRDNVLQTALTHG